MKNKFAYILVTIFMVIMIAGCSNLNVQEEEENNNSTPTMQSNKDLEETNSDENTSDNTSSDNDSNTSKNNNLKKQSSDNNNSYTKNETPKTHSTKTIVIDPGHSSTGTSGEEPIAPNSSQTKLKDGLGATGEYTNIPEHITNMSIALKLKKQLVSRGYNVVMTKYTVSESKSNIERANIANKNNADLMIRIHADSSDDYSISGASMHVPGNNQYTSNIYELSKSYGQTIINTYTNELNFKNRGVIERNDLTGFNWSKVPVVLIEMGFLSNRNDDEFISNTENHSQIAIAIADGIDKCFN